MLDRHLIICISTQWTVETRGHGWLVCCITDLNNNLHITHKQEYGLLLSIAIGILLRKTKIAQHYQYDSCGNLLTSVN